MKEHKLYNVMFPIWFFFLFPAVWLIIIPVNFVVDSIVIILSLKYLKYPKPLEIWKAKILPVWLLGFLADVLGALVVVGLYTGLCEFFPALGSYLVFFPGTCLVAMPGVALAGVLIYYFNRKITFRNGSLEPDAVHRVCLHLALFTAPYTMLIPLYW